MPLSWSFAYKELAFVRVFFRSVLIAVLGLPNSSAPTLGYYEARRNFRLLPTQNLGLFHQWKLIRGQMRDSGKALLGPILTAA